uniref:Uncharacterized protein n=1 Tax=candidate division WOR-3 bacterium TaxID=2052148 RepID=A0A7V3KN73_UNCW3
MVRKDIAAEPDESFEEIINDLILRYPEIKSELKRLLFKFRCTEKTKDDAQQRLAQAEYKLSKAEEKIGQKIDDRVCNITIRLMPDKSHGVVEKVDINDKSGLNEFIDNIIGKDGNSSELNYLIRQLEIKGIVVNLEVKKCEKSMGH